jgi:hypothetical protein
MSTFNERFIRTLPINLLLFVALVVIAPRSTWAESDEATTGSESTFDEILSAITGGKPIMDVNLRWEYAKIDTFTHSHAATVRTRFGYQTKPIYGVSGLLEGVNTSSPKPSAYFDGVESPNSQSIVADPERTDINRVWAKFEKKEWAGLALKSGRQRIKLDDDRWVGNVGWRQNEQTFDAVRLQTNLGSEKLTAQYIYAWGVKRIFADKGPAGRRDYGPRSHFMNLAYQHDQTLEAVVFAYLIDPNDDVFDANGSNTYGLRLSGKVPINDDFSLPYQASYAHQTDAGDNQVSYDADYYMLEGGLKMKSVGGIALGYEVLGSDRDAVVVTPFATAHKFNGFADAFLDNGGVRGLRDLFVTVTPAIPLKGVKMKLIFHQFYDDQGGDNLGQEYDLVTSYQLNKYISFLYKLAYFDGGKNRSPLSRTRSFLQTTFKF